MTDNEIVKALECCTNEHLGCEDGCPYADVGCYDEDGFLTIPMKDALDLIKRQKAEIENLNIELQAMRGAANFYKAEVERMQENIQCVMSANVRLINQVGKAKAEAIKEFAEKLKEYFPSIAKAIDHTAEELIG